MELALAFERSKAVERFERIERAAVLNSADPGCGDFDPAGSPSARLCVFFSAGKSHRLTAIVLTEKMS
jgi:hypothetical protein